MGKLNAICFYFSTYFVFSVFPSQVLFQDVHVPMLHVLQSQ